MDSENDHNLITTNQNETIPQLAGGEDLQNKVNGDILKFEKITEDDPKNADDTGVPKK
jgi:hypothetical protein